jgi:excisionase family DNA binding protein
MSAQDITWLSTAEAARKLGIGARTLYRLIDEGQIPAYKFGRVIRLQEREVDAFIDGARIKPGTLDHLYPDSKTDTSVTDGNRT